MLTERIIAALTFRTQVYADVERDTEFTNTAWALVVVVALLNQFGSHLFDNFIDRIIGTVVGAILSVIGFAVAVYIIHWIGRSLFNADVTFDELVRTLGLAYVWQAIGFVGFLATITPVLGCLLWPTIAAGVLLMLIAWFLAAKEALDLDWSQTFLSVIIGWIAMLLIGIILNSVVYSTLGLG